MSSHAGFFNKGLQNPASTSMDVHSQLLQTKLGEKANHIIVKIQGLKQTI
jgi:hypothetical protein